MPSFWKTRLESLQPFTQKEVCFNLPFEDLKKRFVNIDIIGLDVDNCLISGHGQIHLARSLLPEILSLAVKTFPLGFSKKMLSGISGLFLFQIKKQFGVDCFNEWIMNCFGETLQGVSGSSFALSVSRLINYIRPGAEVALRYLSTVAPVILLSLGVKPVVEELVAYWQKKVPGFSAGIIANPVEFKEKTDGFVFSGYGKEGLIRNGRDKMKAFKREASKLNARAPIIIGHDENDKELAEWAKRRNGISIGFRPDTRFESLFDVGVKGSWYQFVEVLEAMRGGIRTSSSD
jgi:hypothetical protein